MVRQSTAILRTCASCEWIFKSTQPNRQGCPKCGFGSYGARWVYGNIAYRYLKTQKPWKEKQLHKHAVKLDQIIYEANTEPLQNLLGIKP